MSDATSPMIGGLTPYITVRGAVAAAEFYKRAFAAEEMARTPDGDRLIHCHLRINGSHLMMSDEFPEYGHDMGGGPSGVTLHLQVKDPREWWDRAVEAGATVAMPMAVQFWGDEYGQLRDPFGHTWSIGGPAKG
ncbi:MAG TPA: glyoxalase/bleomycin resistance/extradiol dioxygenase family protein [Longimicrobium sp.]